MTDEGRVEPGPAVRRGVPVVVRFEGSPVRAFEGETVGAALHASGERVLMRSIKYHRPRGLFCNTGACASCLVRVDGAPNQRACMTPVREGMRIETQNSFPSARRDFFAVIDKVYRRNFDHHEKFVKPRWLAPFFSGIVRRMAGFGDAPDVRPMPPRRPAQSRRDVDVVVVGAGPAGLAAAVAASEGAASVLLVDAGERAGGSLLLHGDVAGEHGLRTATELLDRLEAAGGELLSGSTATGIYRSGATGETLAPPGTLAVMTPERMVEVHARSIVIATGFHEVPPVCPGNDLPGVMGARAALILLHGHGVLPGRRVIAVSQEGIARRVVRDLEAVGVVSAGVVGEGALEGARLVAIGGRTRVKHVVLEKDGRTWRERVDLVVTAGGETPRIELLQQAGAALHWDGARYTCRVDGAATSVAGVFAAGELLGPQDVEALLDAGARAGEAAAKHARGSPL